MAASQFLTGRAGGASLVPHRGTEIQVQIVGLPEFLKRAAAADPMFNQEIRKASVALIGQVVTEVQTSATYADNPRQAMEAAKGFRARPDRIPVVKLNASGGFVSKSRPNRKRKQKVTRGDVFFGSEFGSDRLRQFPRRSPRLGNGNRGYWFWPTIEAMAPKINSEYIKALDSITKRLERM
jgi:hypothetical protein